MTGVKILIKHGTYGVTIIGRTWDSIKGVLEKEEIEGIVFHHHDGRMCKIRKSDFGIKRKKPMTFHIIYGDYIFI